MPEPMTAVEQAREAVRAQMTSPFPEEDDARLATLEARVREAVLEEVRARVEALELRHFDRCESHWDKPCNCLPYVDRAEVLSALAPPSGGEAK